MDFIKSWITNICAALIFITAVDLILPDNSIKKYCKLILGLILMVVVINPVLSLIGSDLKVDSTLENYLFNENTTSINSNGDLKSSVTEKQFKKAIEDEITAILKKELPEYSFTVNAEVEFQGIEEAEIKNLEIGYKDASVKNVEKINIGKNAAEQTVSNSNGIEYTIADILYDQGSISKDLIKIYKY